MVKTVDIGNNIETFYSVFSDVISNMYSGYSVGLTILNNSTYYIAVKNENDRLVMDMYILSLLPSTEDITLKQLVICNNLSFTSNNEIDFTNFALSNIGPCVYTYNENNVSYRNTYWINNTDANTLNINTGDTNIDSLYKQIYQFSFNSVVLPTDDYNEIKYLWLGFKSYQNTVPLFYITLTNKENFGVFGITNSVPTVANSYFKAITTKSNTPIVYDLNSLSVQSTVVCLSNIFAPESINHEYFPYLYFCVGKDTSASNYIQLEANGVEYIKGLNNLIAITSNPKFTLYQKISYTLNIFNTNYYTLNSIKLIDNAFNVKVNWGDGTPDTDIMADTPDVFLHHNYTPNGTYTLTIYYVSLINPNLLSNIAITDKYTTKIDLSKAVQLSELDIADLFKLTDPNYTGILTGVILPPNLVNMNVDGFCENRTNLTNLTFPTTNCTLQGQWLYNSAVQKGVASVFTYPANITFTKNTNNLVNDFYTGNFSDTIIINSTIGCDTFFVGDYVNNLTLNGVLNCVEITADLDYQNNNNCRLTSLTIADNCSLNLTAIHNLPSLTTINVGGNTTTLYNLNHLDSLTTLLLADTVTAINLITYCNSLTALNISQYVTSINSNVGNYCNSFSAFNVDVNNSNYSSLTGVLYDKNITTLIRIPYGYSTANLALYEVPSTVTSIGAYSMFTKNTIPLISLGSNVASIDNDFLGNGHIGILYINSDVLSSSEFSAGNVDSLILTNAVTTLNTGIFSNVSISSLTIYDEDIILNTNMFNMNDLVLIKGYVNSTAETFANTNNITFVPISFGTNTTKYNITIPSNNYTLTNVCSLSQSYSQINWGDGSDPETIYTLDDSISHTYETAGNYNVTITHIAPASVDFSYTNINQGLFSVATALDFSELTLCSNVVTNLFNNLSNVTEIVYPPNITSITNTLNGTNSITSITLPTSLTVLANSFNNQNYNSLSTLTLPTGLTNITNCFNYTNVIKGTTLNLDSTNTTNGLTITDSFNECSSTVTSITFGENVFDVVNSFMNLLTVTTLTVNASNTHITATNNILCNYAGTELVLVPGGLTTFTIPNTITTLLQGSIANIKTYAEIIIPVSVSTINYPFYNNLNEQSYTTITSLRALNPYTSMVDINKIITTTEGGVTTYLDTANVIGIVGYEHSIIHSQIEGYERYPNCSTYTFTSLGYYNSSIVLGSTYTSQLFTNAQLLAISENLINTFNTNYNYIVPNKTVYSHLTELETYITTNAFDYTSYPYVIIYYIDTVNNIYNYIIYVFDTSYVNTSITIDSADTYTTRKITINYDVANTTYTNLVDEGSFSTQTIITSAVDTYEVLFYKGISAILQSDNTNITPTFLKYTTLIQENSSIANSFIGYVIGSNDTGTNKLFLTNPIIRIDDYWINVNSNLIDADNIVHINSYIINQYGDFATTTISGNLPLTFNGYGNNLINYTIYGTSGGCGVETINLFNKNATDTTNGFIENAYLNSSGSAIINYNFNVSEYIPVNANTNYTLMTAKKNEPYICYYDSSKQFLSSTAYTYTRPRRFKTPSDAAYVRLSMATTAIGNMLLLGSYDEAPNYEPYGYKIPLTNTSGVTENLIEKSDIGFSPNTTIVYTYLQLEPNTQYTAWTDFPYNETSDVFIRYGQATSVTTNQNGFSNGNPRTASTDAEGWITIATRYNSNRPNPADYNYMLVKGSTAPTEYIPHRYITDYNLYIGDTKLGADEYLDYSEQKVYKLFPDIFDETAKDPDKGYVENSFINTSGEVVAATSGSPWVSEYIAVKPNTTYALSGFDSAYSTYALCRYDSEKQFISGGRTKTRKTYVSGANDAFIRVTVPGTSTAVARVIQEAGLDPYNPPVPFLAITAYDNTNTLTSIETLGNVTLKVSEPNTTMTEIEEDVTTLKLIRTDKYMFENNVELVSPIYELPTT